MSHIFIEAITDSGVELDGDLVYVVDASAYIDDNPLFSLCGMAERYGPDDYEYPDFIWDLFDRLGVPQLPSLDYSEYEEDKLRAHLERFGHTLTIFKVEDNHRGFSPMSRAAVSADREIPPVMSDEELQRMVQLAERLRERDYQEQELDF